MGWASIIPAADPVDSAVAKILVPLSPQSTPMTLLAKPSRQSISGPARFFLFTAEMEHALRRPFSVGCAARLGPLLRRPTGSLS